MLARRLSSAIFRYRQLHFVALRNLLLRRRRIGARIGRVFALSIFTCSISWLITISSLFPWSLSNCPISAGHFSCDRGPSSLHTYNVWRTRMISCFSSNRNTSSAAPRWSSSPVSFCESFASSTPCGMPTMCSLVKLLRPNQITGGWPREPPNRTTSSGELRGVAGG